VRREGARRFAAAFVYAITAFATIAVLPGASVAEARNEAPAVIGEIAYATLPREAQQTLQSIKRGGPYAYERDGVVFGNYERRLAQKNRGYYHEYTVATPGAKNRGARRIIAGAGGEYYYTDDHYRTFKRVRE
jgi:ribonuclease T1